MVNKFTTMENKNPSERNEMAEDYIQTNVSITKEDAEKLDKLMQLHFLDNRSAFIRRLIRQEWVRVTGEPVIVARDPGEES